MSGNSHESFYLDKLHGKLYTNAVLDREQRASYTLVVKATNDPNFIIDPEQEVVHDPEDPTQAIVTINVEDENDTPPSFLQKLYYAGELKRYSFMACVVHSWQQLFSRSFLPTDRRIMMVMSLQGYSPSPARGTKYCRRNMLIQ